MICVIDAGLGNVRAMCNMLTRIGAEVRASAERSVIESASHIILPGVGAFDRGMSNLRAHGLLEVLAACAVERRVPILGVCLGMQFMSAGSEEGSETGIGWFPERATHLRKLADGAPMRVPHMGWSYLETASAHPLLKGLDGDARFYFAHSYAIRGDAGDAIACSSYAGVRFAAIIGRGNLAGVQFHPEKSHRFGMQVLKNFAEWSG
jgi:glutamine amidotransferase